MKKEEKENSEEENYYEIENIHEKNFEYSGKIADKN
jgi:hypothetical protein